jgi:hypothetical protein
MTVLEQDNAPAVQRPEKEYAQTHPEFAYIPDLGTDPHPDQDYADLYPAFYYFLCTLKILENHLVEGQLRNELANIRQAANVLYEKPDGLIRERPITDIVKRSPWRLVQVSGIGPNFDIVGPYEQYKAHPKGGTGAVANMQYVAWRNFPKAEAKGLAEALEKSMEDCLEKRLGRCLEEYSKEWLEGMLEGMLEKEFQEMLGETLQEMLERMWDKIVGKMLEKMSRDSGQGKEGQTGP